MQLLGRRLLKLLHGLLQASHGAFERDDLVERRAESLLIFARALHEQLLQQVDVALQAARPLVEP